jgi:hypothetical protein
MILSFSRGFAFVAVPRTAGHAIRTALRPVLAANDWEQCTRFERRLFPVPALAAIGHGHLTWEEVQPFLLPGQWERLFTFAVVRDPFDRFLSYAYFLHAGSDDWRHDPMGTMKRDLAERRGHILLRPQHAFLCDGDGRIAVDRVARYETLQQDFDQICGKFGCKPVPLQRINESRREGDIELDAELIELIEARYAEDFALFGYSRRGEGR